MKRYLAAGALGLPAALFAHAMVFGSEHAVAGAFSAVAFGAGVLAAIGALALLAGNAVQGSVVANRARSYTPALAALLIAAGGWFAVLESCESAHHVAPLLVIAAAIALACVFVRFAIAAFAQAIAAVIITAIRLLVTGIAPLCAVVRFEAPRPVCALAHTRRRYSRPPPALS